MNDSTIDREFAEKFLRSIEAPFEYPVYLLFHDWWAEAPQAAIDEYATSLLAVDGAEDFLAERYLPDPVTLDDMAECAPGTLGAAYRAFIVENNLEADLARNYHDFHAQLSESGSLDRLPADLAYMIVRGFQIHDFLHVVTGHRSNIPGELGMAAFHFAQLQFPYHAMRLAVTTAHIAYVSPKDITTAMDALAAGWTMGRTWQNLHFVRWEDELDTPLSDLRARFGSASDLANVRGVEAESAPTTVTNNGRRTC